MTGNFQDTQTFGEFPMPRHLRNFPNTQTFGEFSNTYMNLGDFPNAWVFGKFPRHSGIWEIPHIPLGI